jgi:hypothetical protein
VRLGTHGFDRGDEIYSWNFWAIQHYFGEPIDFFHTGAPYPQLFPKLLAFCYQLLGNTDLQLPLKATLIIFPWAMLTAIAMVARYRLGALKVAYWLLFIFVLKGVGLAQFFDDGYADPVMTSALIGSIVLFWFSQQDSLFTSGPFASLRITPMMVAGFSVLCALMAAYTKQPALLWTMFSLPVMFLLVGKEKKDRRWWWYSLISFGAGLAWMLTEGKNFQNNQGVLWLSLGDRGILAQLAYAFNKYFIRHPALLVVFAFAIMASRHEKNLRRFVIFFMIPGLLCWLIMGAYQLRLGQHLIALAFLIWAASGRYLPSFGHWNPPFKKLLATTVGLSFCFGGLFYVNEIWIKKGGTSLYAGGRQSLQRYFGPDTEYVYNNIYSDPNVTLWVPSRYLYGLFYRHTQLILPDYLHYPVYNHAAVVDELKRKSPDFAFTVSPAVIDGPASQLLKEIVEKCPSAFQVVSGPQGKFSFVTYKIDKTALQQDQCLAKLQGSQEVALISQ